MWSDENREGEKKPSHRICLWRTEKINGRGGFPPNWRKPKDPPPPCPLKNNQIWTKSMMMLMRNMRTMASQLWSVRASASPHIATQNLQNTNHDTPTNVFHLWRFLHNIQKTINSFYAINTSTCQKKRMCRLKCNSCNTSDTIVQWQSFNIGVLPL